MRGGQTKGSEAGCGARPASGWRRLRPWLHGEAVVFDVFQQRIVSLGEQKPRRRHEVREDVARRGGVLASREAGAELAGPFYSSERKGG